MMSNARDSSKPSESARKPIGKKEIEKGKERKKRVLVKKCVNYKR